MAKWETLKQLYRIRRNVPKYEKFWWGFFPWHKKESFFGIALAAYAAVVEYVNVYLYKRVFTLLHNRIKDGYSMLLLGPFVFAWWIISGIIIATTNLAMAPFVIPVGLWTFIFEFPSAALIGDFESPKISKAKPKKKKRAVKTK